MASQPLAFALAVGLTEAAAGKLPGFADLLHLTDLLPDTLMVLGDHTGTLSGYT